MRWLAVDCFSRHFGELVLAEERMLVGNGNVNGLQACCALQTNDVVGAKFKLALHPSPNP